MSGAGARPMRPNWASHLLWQCRQHKTAAFFKQFGTWRPVGYVDRGPATDPVEYGWERKGGKNDDPSQWPEPFRVQEFPREVRPSPI